LAEWEMTKFQGEDVVVIVVGGRSLTVESVVGW
jgi:hypothetical protein